MTDFNLQRSAEVCYTFVTLEDDVLKSPFLSYFLRNKFIQVPSSAFKMSVINKAEMPCLSHFFVLVCSKKYVKMFTLFYTHFLVYTFSVFSSSLRFCSSEYREKQ